MYHFMFLFSISFNYPLLEAGTKLRADKFINLLNIKFYTNAVVEPTLQLRLRKFSQNI